MSSRPNKMSLVGISGALSLLVFLTSFNVILTQENASPTMESMETDTTQEEFTQILYDRLQFVQANISSFLTQLMLTNPDVAWITSRQVSAAKPLFTSLKSEEMDKFPHWPPHWIPHWPPQPKPNDTQCTKDLLHLLDSIRHEKSIMNSTWLIEMIDAAGKLKPGLLRGAYQIMGNYDECLAVSAPTYSTQYSKTGIVEVNPGFTGRYCTLNVAVPQAPMGLPLGLCVPSSCNETELIENLDNVGAFLHKYLPFVTKHIPAGIGIAGATCLPFEDEREHPADGSWCIAIIGIILAINIIATLHDLYYIVRGWIFRHKAVTASYSNLNSQAANTMGESANDQNEQTGEQVSEIPGLPPATGGFYGFLACFSIYRNGSKLLQVNSASNQNAKGPNQSTELTCLHGIRVISMCWIIFGHNYIYPLVTMDNMLDFFDSAQNTFWFQGVINSTVSVDTFFVMSGFLVAYLFFTSPPTKRRNWFYYYVHRFLRLTPAYLLILWFDTSVLYQLGEGPLWDYGATNMSDRVHCQNTWWRNVLYINNFVEGGLLNTCMAWTWYLANDMQFHWVCPLFLITISWKPKVGVPLTVAAVAASMGATAAIDYDKNLGLLFDISRFTSSGGMIEAMESMADYFLKIYEAPWCRIGPYLMGVIFGYALSRDDNSPTRTRLSWKGLFSGWILSIVATGVVLYSLYHADLTRMEAALYTSLTRPVWSLALIFIIYVCITDQCRPVNAILSYPAFVPLSRATYIAYLIHPLVISSFYSSLKTTTHFSHLNFFVYFTGIAFWTYLMAMCISIVAEAPFIGLEKLIVSSLKSSRPRNVTNENSGDAPPLPTPIDNDADDKKAALGGDDEYATPGTSAGGSGGASTSSSTDKLDRPGPGGDVPVNFKRADHEIVTIEDLNSDDQTPADNYPILESHPKV